MTLNFNETVRRDNGSLTDLKNFCKENGGDTTELEQDVSDLQTAVGDEDSGLVKDVNTLKTDVSSLEGYLAGWTLYFSESIEDDNIVQGQSTGEWFDNFIIDPLYEYSFIVAETLIDDNTLSEVEGISNFGLDAQATNLAYTLLTSANNSSGSVYLKEEDLRSIHYSVIYDDDEHSIYLGMKYLSAFTSIRVRLDMKVYRRSKFSTT